MATIDFSFLGSLANVESNLARIQEIEEKGISAKVTDYAYQQEAGLRAKVAAMVAKATIDTQLQAQKANDSLTLQVAKNAAKDNKPVTSKAEIEATAKAAAAGSKK